MNAPTPANSPACDFSEHDRLCMARALQLAAQGEGRVEPNPMVGCVITDGQRIVAEGWHQRFGEPHAEVNALRACRDAGVDPAGLTLIVTLEPCSHHGKTPPCADAILAAKIGRVVTAMVDPYEAVAGRGVAKLREAGVRVDVGLMQQQAQRLNAPWLKRIRTGLPYVTLKWAQTLDGRIATRIGHSQWISGPAARQRVHELRGRVDAILVGVGTVTADDPQLTARDVEVRRVARRVVVDPTLRLPIEAKLLNDAGPQVTIATKFEPPSDARCAKELALSERGVEVVELPANADGSLQLRPLLRHLSEHHQATNVLVEGGGVLHGHLLRQGLADRLMTFIAPKLLADADARAAMTGGAIEQMSDAVQLHLTTLEQVGEDILAIYDIAAEKTV